MKTVFIVVREYDVEGYRIAGIFEKKSDAETALLKNDNEGYGTRGENRIEEVELNKYFDVNDISL